MHPALRPVLHLATFAFVAVTSCRPPALPAPSEATSPITPQSARVSASNVAAIILAANNTDLSYARLVPARSNNAEVRAFAQRMLTDHTLLNARVNDIAARARLTAEDNALSLDFRDHSAARRDVLRELAGARFDSTYIANEIQYHQEFLAAINDILLPSTAPGQLRDFVASLMPAVSAHLAHAEQLRATLASRR